jgi:hypothetical protein
MDDDHSTGLSLLLGVGLTAFTSRVIGASAALTESSAVLICGCVYADGYVKYRDSSLKLQMKGQ